MRFFNSTQKNMSFSDVIASIRYFIKMNPDSKFKLAVGTHSKVKGRHTCFTTGIHIHRVGQGAWCCISKQVDSRHYRNMKERIAKETAITYELIHMLNEQLMSTLGDFSATYKNFECKLEAHIDIGQKGETRKLIKEMTGYFQEMDIDTKVKPEAFVASSYAGRYSKRIEVG